MSAERQLAAILFSDIAGYTSMMQSDEREAIAKVERYREVLERTVPEFEGEIIQYYGDGSLTIFKSAVMAAECAIQLQTQFRKEPEVPLRIGIHIGEILVQDKKVFGDGVNLASRIESLGQPGAVLFSGRVHEELHNHSGFPAVFLGRFKFKHVAKSMRVYALANEGLKVPDRKTLEGKLEVAPNRFRYKIPLIILLFLLPIAIISFYNFSGKKGPGALPFGFSQPKKSDYSIAVMPFVNMSAEESQAYFADGLSEELLNLLSQIPELAVTSRTSTFSFKGQNVDVPTIAEKLGVNYVLEGSVRKAGDRVRVTAQLIRADGDVHLWSQTWDRELKDIFAIQDEVAAGVVQALRLRLLQHDLPTMHETDPQAYNLYLQGRDLFRQGNIDALKMAEKYFQESIAIDSTYAPTWAALGNAYSRQANIGARPVEDGYQLAEAHAQRAIKLDSTYAPAYLNLAMIALYYHWDFSKAEAYLNKAVLLDPGSTGTLMVASTIAFCLGKMDDAIQADLKVIELDPVSTKHYFNLAQTYLFAGKLKQAEEAARKGLELRPDFPGGQSVLCESLLHQGRYQEALAAAEAESLPILSVHGKALAHFSLGNTAEADAQLKELIDQYAEEAAFQVAQVYAYRGEVDAAFEWIDKAYENRDGGLVQFLEDPLLKKLHGDKRWNLLVRKMQLGP